jgi:hypothetical protein
MRKVAIFILLVSVFALKVKAQTGIGTTTPNASAKLDVTSTTQGFLPPRVTLTGTNDNTTIKNSAGSSVIPATGLLVYNTSTTTTDPFKVVPGYYYYNGTSWVSISNGLIIDNSKSAAFTLASSDNNKVFLISSATALTVSVPNTLPVGFTCQIIQGGVGSITLSPFASSGVTLNSSNGLSTRAANSVIGLIMNTTTTGFIMGDSIF